MSIAAVSPLPTPEPAPRSPEFEAGLLRLRRVMVTWPQTYLLGQLSRMVLRLRPGQAMTRTERMLASVVAMVLRFLVPALVTTATESWSGAPIWTWLAIVAFTAALEAGWGTAVADPWLEKQVALPAVLEHEADLRRLLEFTERRWHARSYVPAALLIAGLVLTVGAVVSPALPRGLHPGSVALLALVLYEFGENLAMRFLYFGLFSQESRFAHRLSWLSPADSPAIQSLLGVWAKLTVISGIGLALDFAIVVLLVAPSSLPALLGPIAGFAVAAVVVDTASLMSLRTSVRRVVRHSRDATLDRLRRRIDSFEPRLEELTPAETTQLQGLIATYAAVRDAPTGVSNRETFGHAVSALAIPALAFFIAVMVEVYAERLLDQLLP